MKIDLIQTSGDNLCGYKGLAVSIENADSEKSVSFSYRSFLFNAPEDSFGPQKERSWYIQI